MAKDNMSRTSFHYACIMNDIRSIEILEQARAPQLFDCLNFFPHDYRFNHQLRADIHAEDFPKDACQRRSGIIVDFLTIAFYPNFKQAIENDMVSDIKLLNGDLIRMGFHLRDFKATSKLTDYMEGLRYIPLLFLVLEHRAIASIRCLIQLGLPITGQMHIVESQLKQYFRSELFRHQKDMPHCLDISQMVDALDDGSELKEAFKHEPTTVSMEADGISIKTERESHFSFKRLAKRQMVESSFHKSDEGNQVAESQSCIVM